MGGHRLPMTDATDSRPRYDLEAIRQGVTMMDLLARDGVEVKRKGTRWICCCPFHNESTASFSITERTGLWRCFGCGAGGTGSAIKGDLFGYYMATRGLEFAQAVVELAVLAGTGVLLAAARLPDRKPIERKPDALPEPLAGRDLETWVEGVEHLRGSECDLAALAWWRGYSPDTCVMLAARGVIGRPRYRGERCWAWGVEARREDGTRYLCGWHVRLDPEAGEKRASWRFVPGSSATQESIGAWPMVLGEPATARAVIFCEGEWDLGVVADVTAWGILSEKKMAIFGLRGGRNLRHTLAYAWPREAQAFLFPDSDDTGSSWIEPEGLACLVRPRVRAVHAFTFEGCKDLNDYHKSRGAGQREQWSAFFREHFKAGLRRRMSRKAKTFNQQPQPTKI